MHLVHFFCSESRLQMPKADKKDNKNQIRENWGGKFPVLPQLDLLSVQKEISPIDDFTGKNWSLVLKDYRLGDPTNDPETCLIKGITYDVPLYVKATLINKKTEGEINQEVFLGDIPKMTD